MSIAQGLGLPVTETMATYHLRNTETRAKLPAQQSKWQISITSQWREDKRRWNFNVGNCKHAELDEYLAWYCLSTIKKADSHEEIGLACAKRRYQSLGI